MFRRRTATPQLQRCLQTSCTARQSATDSIPLLSPRRTLFGNIGKAWNKATGSADKATHNTADTSSASGVPPGFPPGFNAQQMQTMQQLFNSQPKEKQEQLLKQAMEMQKVMGKVPGMGKFIQRNAGMLEQMMKAQGSAAASPVSMTETPATSPSSVPPPRKDLFSDAARGTAGSLSSSSRSNSGTRPTGPSLDDLKKVNLGPEIEALFTELRQMRTLKNEYRDKFHAAESTTEKLRTTHATLAATEANLRGRLSKAEQEVMLVTSENMELRESSKNAKQLTQTNKHLKQELAQLRATAQANAAPGSAAHTDLTQQLKEKEDQVRSLQRKVDRMRRRDPLLQFSLACSDVSRLCGAVRADEASSASSASTTATVSNGAGVGVSPVGEAGQEAAEAAFAVLQTSYQEKQQEAWQAAAHANAAAAKAYIAVVRRYVITRAPHANLDAAVTFTGHFDALRVAFAELGYTAEAVAGEANRAHVLAAPDAEMPTKQPGPYGYALAMQLSAAASTHATESATDSAKPAFTITHTQPMVSLTLLNNTRRSSVQYDTARASGPGGQATNVTETQVYARLMIDGAPAFTAEAQDSRSALANKEAALDKLRQARRVQYNEALARQSKTEAVVAPLTEAMRRLGGLIMEGEVMDLVGEAAASGQVPAGDVALVRMLRWLGMQAPGA